VTRPLSGGIFAVMALIIVVSAVTARRRKNVFGRVGADELRDDDTQADTQDGADRMVPAADGSPGVESPARPPDRSPPPRAGER
jgi:putative tricarboxylic transport membrane protein